MNRQKYVNLGRTINLFNVSLFKNPRTYVIGMILPICISIVLNFLWTRYSFLDLTPPEMLSFIFIPVIFGSFYIGLFANESRQNNFIEKIEIKINNKNIIKYSLVILAAEVAAINLFFTAILFFIISRFNIVGLDEDLFSNLEAYVWVYFAIFGMMLGIMSALIFLLVGLFFRKNLYVILLMSVVFLFMLFFSDTVVPSKDVSNVKAMTIIGYFNPVKYITWSMNLISSYQFDDAFGKTQIYVSKSGSFEPFNNLWETTVPAIILLISLWIAYGYKKEKK